MSKFQDTANEWRVVNAKLYQDCKEYLETILNKAPANEIIINDNASVCVSYDGGNHPEYDSNCFSNVSRVYLKDNKVYLEIEETDEYSIENIEAGELYGVANSVEETIAMDYDLEE